MELSEFLDLVVTSPEGFFCFASGGPNVGGWSERWYRWPAQREEILEAVTNNRGTSNLYFSSYLFKAPSSTKQNVLPSRTISADLDFADITNIRPEPTVIVRTSPGRHQAYWVLREALDPETHELISRKLTYSIPKCDTSGWWLGHKFRLPDTFNLKYLDGPKPIEVIHASRKTYSSEDFEALPDAPSATETKDQDDWLSRASTIKLDVGPNELLESIKNKGLHPKTYLQFNVPAADRSAALWSLMCAGFRCGLERDAVFWLAKHSKNNKFADLRFNGDRELAKDILRAEATVRKSGADPKDAINQLRRLTPTIVRKQAIFKNVVQFMRERGTFFHAVDDTLWYIRRDVGRPVIVAEVSDYMDAMLDLEYGLNKTETEHNYVAAGLVAYTRNLPVNSHRGALSYYDTETKTLLLHTGRRDVFHIGPDFIKPVVDGAQSVIFPWQSNVEPFTLGTPDLDWAEHLFGQSAGRDALSNVIGMEREHALAMLKVWFLFLLFRTGAHSRPLLALFGQPGSGKSALFKKVYALLYGRHKAIESITKEESFDHVVSSDPLVVLDNVDSWKEWLPDRLALSAGTSDITKRKLYTNADSFVLKRQAMVGLTAHNPRFGREDVADRLLLLSYERLDHFAPEQAIIDAVTSTRSELWGGVAADVQRVLSTPMPSEGPQFRVEDFARLGHWIATALNIGPQFTKAIGSIRVGQNAFTLDEERLLVDALKFVVVNRGPIIDRSPQQLWAWAETAPSIDPIAFGRAYRGPIAFGKKLLVMQNALKEMFDITWKVDPVTGKLWTILPKGHVNGTA